MSVLRTFFIAFKSDDKEVKASNKAIVKGAKEAGRAEDKLERKVKSTTADINASMRKRGAAATAFAGKIKAAIGIIAAAVTTGAVVSVLTRTIDRLDDLNIAANRFSMPATELNAWEKAAEGAGGSADSVRGAFARMSQVIAEASMEPEGTQGKMLEGMGISLVDAEGKAKSVVDMMMEMADVTDRIGSEAALSLFQIIGFDQATISLWQKGGDVLRETIKTEKERSGDLGPAIEMATKLAEKQLEISAAWERVSNAALVKLGPMMELAYDNLIGFLNILTDSPDKIEMVTAALGAFAVAIGLVTIAAFWFPLLIGSAVALVVAAIVYFKDDIGKALDWIGVKWDNLVEWATKAANNIAAAFEDPVQAIKDLFNGLMEFLQPVFDLISGALEGLGIIEGKEKCPKQSAREFVDAAVDEEKRLEDNLKAAKTNRPAGVFGENEQRNNITLAENALREFREKLAAEKAVLANADLDPNPAIDDAGAAASKRKPLDGPGADNVVQFRGRSSVDAAPRYDAGTSAPDIPSDVMDDYAAVMKQLGVANAAMDVANGTSFNSLTVEQAGNAGAAEGGHPSGAGRGRGNTRSVTNTVNVGDIVIKTEATDAEGIAADAGKAFQGVLDETLDNSDDGTAA